MGMLAYGAMAGVGDEYLKQSGERRQADFQKIRDNRLSGLKKSELTHGADLAAKGAAAQYEREKGDFTAGYGEDIYRGGEKVASGRERPTATSTTQRGNLITMVSGDQRTFEELRKNWEGQAFTKDEFGNQVRNPEVPEWDSWFNDRVQPQHRINPQTGEPEAPAEPDMESIMEANKWYDENSNYLDSDMDQFGMTEKEAKDKKAREIMQDKAGKATSELVPGRGDGMLTEGTQEAKPKITLERPLTQSAKTDPVQMYDELMSQMDAQGFDEQTIIDTIRQHFQDPTWEVPPNALM